MKRILLTPLLALSMTGCLNLTGTETRPAPAKTPTHVVSAKPKLTADQINESNAREMSAALSAELDQAQSSALITPEKLPEPAKK
jgi:hypothetical protein